MSETARFLSIQRRSKSLANVSCTLYSIREPERSLNVRKYESEKVSNHFPFQVVVVMQPVYSLRIWKCAVFFYLNKSLLCKWTKQTCTVKKTNKELYRLWQNVYIVNMLFSLKMSPISLQHLLRECELPLWHYNLYSSFLSMLIHSAKL